MHKAIIAGYGGQGVLLLGQVLATAGMHSGQEVSWYPSYGPEQRGGTCNCSVVLSDKEIGSPIVTEPTAAIIMNLPSFDKFESKIKPGGILIYNSSLIEKQPTRNDITWIGVPCNDISNELGNSRISNMVAFGSFVKATEIIPPASVRSSLEQVLPQQHHKLIDLNMQAFDQGRVYQQGT